MENLRPLSLLGIVAATLLLYIPTESEAKTHRSYAVKAELKGQIPAQLTVTEEGLARTIKWIM